MKKVFTIAALLAVLSISTSQAASIRVDDFGSNTFGVYLDGEADNGNFDTIIVDITPAAGASFSNPDPTGADGFTPRPAGDTTATFINAFLGAPPAFGGNGFSILGPVTTANQVAFSGGPLGGTIDTVGGPNVGSDGLFLANIVLDGPGGMANARLVSGGDVVGNLSAMFGAPVNTVMGTPAPGDGPIDLTGAFIDGSGLLANAIAIAGGDITGLVVGGADAALFGATNVGGDISLTIDRDAARMIMPERDAFATLEVQTTGGNLNYDLTSRVPEPAALSLIGLALVGFVGVRRNS